MPPRATCSRGQPSIEQIQRETQEELKKDLNFRGVDAK